MDRWSLVGWITLFCVSFFAFDVPFPTYLPRSFSASYYFVWATYLVWNRPRFPLFQYYIFSIHAYIHVPLC